MLYNMNKGGPKISYLFKNMQGSMQSVRSSVKAPPKNFGAIASIFEQEIKFIIFDVFLLFYNISLFFCFLQLMLLLSSICL